MAQNDPQTPQRPQARKAAGAGAATAAGLIALALAVTGLKPDEGLRYRTYLDVAKIPTECYGHVDRSAKVGTYHSPAQCSTLLSNDVAIAETGVERCTPVLDDRPLMLAAATRLAFNIGVGAYCHSSVAREFNRKNFILGCVDFLKWDMAAGKPVLLSRREREEAQCLKGI